MINDKTHKLVLIDDKTHDYGYVIASLMKYCEHNILQAEQCTLITDNVGRCTVKEGTFLDMMEIKTSLEELELITEIENYESYMH
jgi:ATP-dependent Clp protease adaptor protein ClpS